MADPEQPWWFRKIVGPAVRDFNNALPPGYRVDDIERVAGPDWCRFRDRRHCLSGDTEIMTIDGSMPIKSLAGSTATILDGEGNWTESPIHSFGEQQLYEVVVERYGERRSIFATAGHRWFITVANKRHEALTVPIAGIEPIHARPKHTLVNIDLDAMTAFCEHCGDDVSVILRHGKPRCGRFVVQGNRAAEKRSEGGVRYRALKPGDTLAVTVPRKYKHGWSVDPLGVMAGFVYGDGWTVTTGDGSGPRGASSAVRMWGEKDAALLPYFSQYAPKRSYTEGEMCSVAGVEFRMLPGFLNRLPDLNESPHFLYGWLAGYFAADGCVAPSGRSSLSSSSRQALEHVVKVCNRLNIAVSEIKTRNVSASMLVPDADGVSYEVGFYGQTLTPEFFLIPSHRERFNNRTPDRSASLAWRVVDIKESDRFEEVFCATVPSTASFALPGYILTGNCFLPFDLDHKATEKAGYDVWIPVDRGLCVRETHEAQGACPVSEPGPESGERVFYPKATRSWAEGGQRQSSLASESAWTDVRDKATRVRRDGQVRIIAYTGNSITAEVKGDSNIYTTTLTRVPGTKQTAMWHCTCPWNTYAWARSGRWKNLEGRMCSHALALIFEAQSQEMFGGQISEMSATPIWRTTEPVEEPTKLPPAPWRLDVAASVRPEAIAFASAEIVQSLLTAESVLLADPATSQDALVRVAQALESARIDADVLAAGGSAGDVLASIEAVASVRTFPARIRGIIRRIVDVSNGIATSDAGETFPASLLVYPTYDPRLGLTAAKTADADGYGVMVAFSPSREVCDRLSNLALMAGMDAELPEQIHLTVAYLGKTGEVDKDAFLAAMKSYAAQSNVMEGNVAGLGTFANGDSHVLWASADVPGIDEFRVGLLPILEAIGSPARNDHGYTPHITLAYSETPITEFPSLEDIAGSPMRFTTLVAAYGGEWHHFDLTGTSGETVAVEQFAKAASQTTGALRTERMGPLYHGTSTAHTGEIDQHGLRPGGDGRAAGAVWLTPSLEIAKRFANAVASRDGGEPAVYEVESIEGVPATEVGYLDLGMARDAGADYSPQGPEVAVMNPSIIRGLNRIAAVAEVGCRECGGEGRIMGEPCGYCGGTGLNIDRGNSTEDEWSDEADDASEWERYGSKAAAASSVDAFRSEGVEAILHDEPEPALPETYGSDEADSDWSAHTEDLDTTEVYSEPPGETVMHWGNQTRTEAGTWAPGVSTTATFTAGDDRLSWLMSGAPSPAAAQAGDFDVAAGARAHLAKTALKDFSPAEQKQIIDEGADEHLGARNDDRLNIEGTFYASMMAGPDDQDDLFW